MFVAPLMICTMSYSLFQLPSDPSVGSHCGKQSLTAVWLRLRMITLDEPSIWRDSPLIPACEPAPMIVVLLGTFATIVCFCLAAAARRASSSAPSGSRSVPQTAGS